MSNRSSTAARTEHEVAAEWRSLLALGQALAHDLRSPINGMVLQLELFDADLSKDGALDRTKTKRRVENMKRELGRLRASLDRLLSFLAPASTSERCDLSELLPELVATVEPAARERGTGVALDEIPSSLPVDGDRTRLRGALLALLVSALDVHEGVDPLRVAVAGDEADVRVSLIAGSRRGPEGEDAKRGWRERLRAATEACELVGGRSSLDMAADGRVEVLVTLPRHRHTTTTSP